MLDQGKTYCVVGDKVYSAPSDSLFQEGAIPWVVEEGITPGQIALWSTPVNLALPLDELMADIFGDSSEVTYGG